MMLGEPILVGRGRDGRVFALRDICPHRGIPLHYGRFDGETIECAYHGWRFDRDGTCVDVPSMTASRRSTCPRSAAARYPCGRAAGHRLGLFSARRREARRRDGRAAAHPALCRRSRAGRPCRPRLPLLDRPHDLRADGPGARRLCPHLALVPRQDPARHREDEELRAEGSRLQDGAAQGAADADLLQRSSARRSPPTSPIAARDPHRGNPRRHAIRSSA